VEFPELRHRSTEQESMDDASPSRLVLINEYRFLRHLNRATAAADAIVDAVADRIPGAGSRRISLVDFGCGGADIPERFLNLSRERGWDCTVLCTDRNEDAIEMGRARVLKGAQSGSHLASGAVGDARIDFRVVDLLAAERVLGARNFDVAHASLVMHHLDDESAVAGLRAMAAVARELVVWNDLVRDSLGIWGAQLSTIVASKELRHDAVVSVRRSFTLAEARAVAEAAGLVDIRARRVRGARFVLTGVPGPLQPQSTGRPLARAEGIRFSYGTRSVLADVNFVARSGELIHVIGANGSGKSTLLACMVGALQPAAGRAWIDQTALLPGYHPQEGGLFSALSVVANLETAARLARVPAVDRSSAVARCLVDFGLTEHAQHRVDRLSGGLKRRTALACAVIHSPIVLVLDEPDAGLDALGREALVRTVEAVLHRRGTVILASHASSWLQGLATTTPRVEVGL
jgi:ABC-type nitrate/sulfonate/bicarbonate transport system ATPase subunit/SAM-dependent methyltransferase